MMRVQWGLWLCKIICVQVRARVYVYMCTFVHMYTYTCTSTPMTMPLESEWHFATCWKVNIVHSYISKLFGKVFIVCCPK